MKYKLYNDDCLEVMKLIPDKSIDMILCDLPYGTSSSTWDKPINLKSLWEQYKRIISNTGSIVLFASGQFIPKLLNSNLSWYKYRWIWVKNHSTNFVHAKNRPMSKTEDVLVFSHAPMGHKSQLGLRRMKYNPQGLIACTETVKAGKSKFGGIMTKRPSHKQEYTREYINYPTDILTGFAEKTPSKKFHTSEKPIPLLEFLIKSYTDEGMTVLDNCMGSGTTGVACVNTNRN